MQNNSADKKDKKERIDKILFKNYVNIKYWYWILEKWLTYTILIGINMEIQ